MLRDALEIGAITAKALKGRITVTRERQQFFQSLDIEGLSLEGKPLKQWGGGGDWLSPQGAT